MRKNIKYFSNICQLGYQGVSKFFCNVQASLYLKLAFVVVFVTVLMPFETHSENVYQSYPSFELVQESSSYHVVVSQGTFDSVPTTWKTAKLQLKLRIVWLMIRLVLLIVAIVLIVKWFRYSAYLDKKIKEFK